MGADGTPPEQLGFFSGDDTFEVDLLEASEANGIAMVDALGTFAWSQNREDRIAEARRNGDLTGEELLAFADAVSKGRFAQRVATTAASLDAPGYVRRALDHLMA